MRVEVRANQSGSLAGSLSGTPAAVSALLLAARLVERVTDAPVGGGGLAVDAVGDKAQQNRDAVSGAAGYFGGRHAGVEPRRHECYLRWILKKARSDPIPSESLVLGTGIWSPGSLARSSTRWLATRRAWLPVRGQFRDLQIRHVSVVTAGHSSDAHRQFTGGTSRSRT